MAERITAPVVASRDNARVVAARRLHVRKHRERERRFLVEGPRALEAALSAGAPVLEVFELPDDPSPAVRSALAAAARRGVPSTRVTRSVLEHLATTETPQGVVAVCAAVDVDLSSVAAGFVCVLVEVQDPGNLGTVLRSADAAGAAGVVVTASSVDPYNPKAVRASAGSLFHLPVVRDLNVAEAIAGLRARGWRILAAVADGAASVYDEDLVPPVAVLFGNEARGLPGEVLGAVDGTIRVPMAGRAGSLNLAASASVVLFEAARQRAEGAAGPPA